MSIPDRSARSFQRAMAYYADGQVAAASADDIGCLELGGIDISPGECQHLALRVVAHGLVAKYIICILLVYQSAAYVEHHLLDNWRLIGVDLLRILAAVYAVHDVGIYCCRLLAEFQRFSEHSIFHFILCSAFGHQLVVECARGVGVGYRYRDGFCVGATFFREHRVVERDESLALRLLVEAAPWVLVVVV